MTDAQYEERQSLEDAAGSGQAMSDHDFARLAAYRIHSDGSDRSGWDAMMNDVSDDIAEEIIDSWTDIILSTMAPVLPTRG
jgi:hypothetical protein